ncbi:hypothetical protein ACMWQB_31155, partial [Escherichia coli]|uniref:hypothetical protein n=1 Tax=Escherichia coli TaxID=562 RepID=UPI0039DFF663
GYYVGMDLLDSGYNIVDSMVCVFDRPSILAGTAPNAPMCVRLGLSSPSSCWVSQGGVNLYQCHSPIPADVEGPNPPLAS